MEITNITNDTKKIADFYRVYRNYFPIYERDALESIKQLAYNAAKVKNWNYNIIQITDEGDFVGGLIYDYFTDINIIVIEFVFITEKFRGKSIVKQLLSYLERTMPDATILGEVEQNSPNVEFWQNKGFSVISTDYIQPKISQTQKPFDGLVLMSNKHIDNLDDVIQNHYWKYCFIK